MIADEMRALEKYINSKCKVRCQLGKIDPTPDDYPFVNIISNLSIPLSYDNRQLVLVNFPVTLKIIVADDNAIVAMEIFEKLLQKINQFNFHKGHEIEDLTEAVPLYDEEDRTYSISVPYMLRLKVQDS